MTSRKIFLFSTLNTNYFSFKTVKAQSKLALTSPTGGGRSVGIVRSRTKAMDFLKARSVKFHRLVVRLYEDTQVPTEFIKEFT